MEDQLGLALELAHRARPSLTTLECTHWTWTHHQRAAIADGRGGPATTAAPTESEQEERIWFVAPARSRREGVHGTEVVRDGERWHVPSGSGPVVHERHEPWSDAGTAGPLHTIALLADPTPLGAACTWQAAGEDDVDGRSAIRVRAVPRADLAPPLSWIVTDDLRGADDLLLSIDRELGVLTRLELRTSGWAFQVEELRHVRAGHHLSAAVFEPDLSGREVLTQGQLRHRLRHAGRTEATAPLGAHEHEATGPPPDDEADATLAIQRALNSLIGPHERDVPGLEGGADLATTLRTARERSRAMVGEVSSLRLDHVRFLHARLADIRCSVVSAGRGSGLQFSGFAFEQDGEWLISRETLAALVGLIGVRLPPRTVGLEPSG